MPLHWSLWSGGLDKVPTEKSRRWQDGNMGSNAISVE